ncbi:hypothetical protein BDN71DRAFT_1450854 [Pleurotus eryngii]|uniref:Uncharacterized protein n=1 Tax=Pleurotus eryngii TaxID=5323 RepID=A0A9P5ZSR2_PLEER|nr:hypothetical protein BDN71DRAFT_1450854 [Pleurotus eryngii]
MQGSIVVSGNPYFALFLLRVCFAFLISYLTHFFISIFFGERSSIVDRDRDMTRGHVKCSVVPCSSYTTTPSSNRFLGLSGVLTNVSQSPLAGTIHTL